MTESVDHCQNQQSEVEEVCIGCPLSERSLFQSTALAIRRGLRYKKDGCPGSFTDFVEIYSTIETPRTGLVVACPDQEAWKDVQARHPGYPQNSAFVGGQPWVRGMDTVEVNYKQHLSKVEG